MVVKNVPFEAVGLVVVVVWVMVWMAVTNQSKEDNNYKTVQNKERLLKMLLPPRTIPRRRRRQYFLSGLTKQVEYV